MDHIKEDGNKFVLLAFEAMKKVFEAAEANDMCPDCMLITMAEYCLANVILRNNYLVNGEAVDAELNRLFGDCANNAVSLAMNLEEALDAAWWNAADSKSVH